MVDLASKEHIYGKDLKLEAKIRLCFKLVEVLFYVGKSQENFDQMNQKPIDRNPTKHFWPSQTKSNKTKATRSSTTVEEDFIFIFQEKKKEKRT